MKQKRLIRTVILILVLSFAMTGVTALTAYGADGDISASELIPTQIPIDANSLLDSGRIREVVATSANGNWSYKQEDDKSYSVSFVNEAPTATDNDQIQIPLFLGVNVYDVAYVAYRFTNTSDDTLIIGTRAYINSGVERIAGATLPLLYSAEDGKPLAQYTTSYSYQGNNKLSMTKSVAMAEILPDQSVYVVVPMSAANVTDRYVPELPMGNTAFTGDSATDGNLIFQNSNHTSKTNEMYAKNGYLYLKAISVVIRGIDEAGDLHDKISCKIDNCFAVGLDSKAVEESWAWADFSVQEPKKLEIPSLSLISEQAVASSVYSKTGVQVTSTQTTEDHYKLSVKYPSPEISSKLTVPFGMDYNISDMRYVAYRIKNTSNETVNIGTRLNLTNGITRQAGATAPITYDAQTGERLELVSSWSYSSGKLIIDTSLSTVEIPAGADVFMLIPMTTVGGSDRVVPGLPQGKLVGDGTKLTDGNLRMRSQDQAQELRGRYEQYGWLNISSIDIYYGGSGAGRAAVSELSYEISELFGVTMDGTVLAYLDLSPKYSYDLGKDLSAIAPIDQTVGVGANMLKDNILAQGSSFKTTYEGLVQVNTKTIIEKQDGAFFDKISIAPDAIGDQNINIYDMAYFGFYLKNPSSVPLPLIFTADVALLEDGESGIPIQVDQVIAMTDDWSLDTSIKAEKSIYGNTFNIPSGWSGWIIIPMLTLENGVRGAIPGLQSGSEAYVRFSGADADVYTLDKISESAYFAGYDSIVLTLKSLNIAVGCNEILKEAKEIDFAFGGVHGISRNEYVEYKNSGTVPTVLSTKNTVSNSQIKEPEVQPFAEDAQPPQPQEEQEKGGIKAWHIILICVAAVILAGAAVAIPFTVKYIKNKKTKSTEELEK